MTTCQICGRTIQSAKGLIAHHGYRRPRDGYQTRSCAGARYAPYEVAHDALDYYIPVVEREIVSLNAALWALYNVPPSTLTRRPQFRGDLNTPTFTRPTGFDPLSIPARRSFRRGEGYELEFRNATGRLLASIEGDKADLVYLRQRLADWHAAQ